MKLDKNWKARLVGFSGDKDFWKLLLETVFVLRPLRIKSVIATVMSYVFRVRVDEFISLGTN